ncbi:matrix metalloproteinase-17-like [Carcharodon carcharias]|uniref:matrix metalloproteinase-17-like n=1 Tax=Carcharodon carcharias TaxID=13397 RepID=UPI001B7E376C|nr:matrix metalloproteinase-17-like [Carcharodon carcharias]
MQHTGNLVSLNAAQIRNFWQGFPEDLTKIDTVYERMTDNKIVFFIGNRYWVFSNTIVDPGYPRYISDFGLPVESIDAAFVWPHNGRTYFFKGDNFWRYDEQGRKMDAGYPKKLSLWKGVEAKLDGVMGWSDGFTYFFKEQRYWKMRGGAVEVVSPAAHSTHRDWMHCDSASDPPQPPLPRDPADKDCSCLLDRNSASAASWCRVQLLAALLASLFLRV